MIRVYDKFNMVVKRPTILTYNAAQIFGNVESCVLLGWNDLFMSVIDEKLAHFVG